MSVLGALYIGWKIIGRDLYNPELVEKVILGLLVLLLLAVLSFAWYFVSRFVRLYGEKRTIHLDNTSITFPEFGDSLEIIRLNYGEIRKVFYATDRYGNPDNLILKYGNSGHAYIDQSALTKEDFEEIVVVISEKLGINEILIGSK
jgi:hypothetical protein